MRQETLEISYDKIKGRCLKSSTSIPKGITIAEERAYTFSLYFDAIKNVCGQCLKFNMDVQYDLKCSGCNLYHYCSEDCKKLNIEQHEKSLQCQFLIEAVSNEIDNEDINVGLFLLTLLYKLQMKSLEKNSQSCIISEINASKEIFNRVQQKNLQCNTNYKNIVSNEKMYTPNFYRIFSTAFDEPDNFIQISRVKSNFFTDLESEYTNLIYDLQTENPKHDNSTEIFENVKFLDLIIKLTGIPNQLLKKFLGLIKYNAFYIVDKSNFILAVSLFIKNCMFNHFCDYNCHVSYEFIRTKSFNVEIVQRIRTIKMIDEGEELTIAYIDNIRPLSSKKEILAKNYCIECSCKLCTQTHVLPKIELKLFLDKFVISNYMNELIEHKIDSFLKPFEAMEFDSSGKKIELNSSLYIWINEKIKLVEKSFSVDLIYHFDVLMNVIKDFKQSLHSLNYTYFFLVNKALQLAIAMKYYKISISLLEEIVIALLCYNYHNLYNSHLIFAIDTYDFFLKQELDMDLGLNDFIQEKYDVIFDRANGKF